MSTPLPPDDLADRLAEVYVALGPVYRRVARIVEHDEHSSGLAVGVRNVLDQLRRTGERTVPQLARAPDLSAGSSSSAWSMRHGIAASWSWWTTPPTGVRPW